MKHNSVSGNKMHIMNESCLYQIAFDAWTKTTLYRTSLLRSKSFSYVEGSSSKFGELVKIRYLRHMTIVQMLLYRKKELRNGY